MNTDAVNDTPESPNEIFESFWKPIIFNDDGTIDAEKVKLELSDYYFIINEVPKVYCAITGNNLSKPNYHASVVIDCANEYYENFHRDNAKEMIKFLIEDGQLSAKNDSEINELLNQFF